MKVTQHLYSTAITLLLSVVLFSCRGQTSKVPPVHPNMNMDQQKRFEPQEENDFFADKRAQRMPVKGTVARSQLHHNTVYYQGINKDSSFVREIPVDVTKSFLYHGQDRYDVFCTPCHGLAGDGKGIIMEGGYGFVPAPTYHQDRLRNVNDGYIYSVISNGIRNMPSYGSQIPVKDRWAIVAYVRALQHSQNTPEEKAQTYNVDLASLKKEYKKKQEAEEAKKEAMANANEGGEVSAKQGRTIAENNACLTCHSTDGSKMTGPSWKNAFGHKVELANGETVTADEDYITESIVKSQAKIVKGYQGVMPNFDYLSDTEVKSLVAYIESLSDKHAPDNESESTSNSSPKEDTSKNRSGNKEKSGQTKANNESAKAMADTNNTAATADTGSLSASALKGKKLFKEFECLSCHVIEGKKQLAPAFKGLFGSNIELKDGSTVIADQGYIKESIQYPGAKVVLGFNNNMPSYRDLLTDPDLQAVSDYIKSLQ